MTTDSVTPGAHRARADLQHPPSACSHAPVWVVEVASHRVIRGRCSLCDDNANATTRSGEHDVVATERQAGR